ncbi:MAG TPA: hypothetical protein VK501_12835 [Baekduia sp.]|uniref:hypothetical protein n=1 Tax=Baekduia sp. TaxID=2600305 RepID=UPI002C2567AB|nr:hypothetical protein [Baekduia sp.]HMJ34791.1 hypothetical protein [Baekduia sp.]
MTRRPLTRPLLLVLGVALAAGILMPAAAQAAPLDHAASTPLGLLGLNVGSLVTDIIKKLVDLVVPDFASHWITALVQWLVAVPDVTDAHAYPHLNAYRAELVGLGFALLAISLSVCALQIAAGAPIASQVAKRAVAAAGVLVLYPKLVSTFILGLNVLTGSMVTQHLVTDGIDKMLGAALVIGIATSGVGWGLAVGAALTSLYFVAGLMIVKIGLTSLEAVLMLAGALVWGLYPLPATAWLARTWIAGAITIALIPVAWALIFAAGALLTSDSLIWASGAHGGLPDELQQIVKPFTAVACLWLAFKAPVFLMAAGRAVGIHPGMVAGPARGGSGGAASGGRRGMLAAGVQTNRDRFRALGAAAAARATPLAANARQRAASLRSSATSAVGKRVAPVASTAAVGIGAPHTATGVMGGHAVKLARTSANGLKASVNAPVKANKAWKELPKKGAAARYAAAAALPGADKLAPTAGGAAAAGGGASVGPRQPAPAAPRPPAPSSTTPEKTAAAADPAAMAAQSSPAPGGSDPAVRTAASDAAVAAAAVKGTPSGPGAQRRPTAPIGTPASSSPATGSSPSTAPARAAPQPAIDNARRPATKAPGISAPAPARRTAAPKRPAPAADRAAARPARPVDPRPTTPPDRRPS